MSHSCDLGNQQPSWYLALALQGFIQRREGGGGGGGGGGAWNFPSPATIPPPPPEILKLSMVIIVLSLVLNNSLVPDCVRSNLRGSKIQNFSRGACPQTPLVGTHTYACYYHPATILFPPNSKSCMKPCSPLMISRSYQLTALTLACSNYFLTQIFFHGQKPSNSEG